MGLILLAFTVTVVTSFCCSLTEAALYSMPLSRIESMRRQGSRAGELLAQLRADIDKPIAAILIINTVANSAGAVWIGALAAELLGSGTLGAITAILTLSILILGEIIPKTIGATHAVQIAPRASTNATT